MTPTTPDPELTITIGETRRRITVAVTAVDWHVATAPDGTRQIVIITEDVEDGRRSTVPMTQFRTWPRLDPEAGRIDTAALTAYAKNGIRPRAEEVAAIQDARARELAEEEAGIPEGAVVEWDAPVTNLALGLTTNGPRARRIGRLNHHHAGGTTAYVIDPDGIATVVPVAELTVIAETAEAGWANLADRAFDALRDSDEEAAR